RTWAVWMKESSAYLQLDLDGNIGSMPYAANLGMRVINTNLDITQHLTGAPAPYGVEAADAGTQVTRRSYRDYLPAANFAINLTDDLGRRLVAELFVDRGARPADAVPRGGRQFGWQSEPRSMAVQELRRVAGVLHQ